MYILLEFDATRENYQIFLQWLFQKCTQEFTSLKLSLYGIKCYFNMLVMYEEANMILKDCLNLPNSSLFKNLTTFEYTYIYTELSLQLISNIIELCVNLKHLKFHGKDDNKIVNYSISTLLNPKLCHLDSLSYSIDYASSFVSVIKNYLVSDASQSLTFLNILSGSNATKVEEIANGLLEGKCNNLSILRIGGMKNPEEVYNIISKALMTKKYSKLIEITLSGSCISSLSLHNVLKPLILGYCPLLETMDYGGFSENNCYNEFVPLLESDVCKNLQTIYVNGECAYSNCICLPLLHSLLVGKLVNLKCLIFYGCSFGERGLNDLWQSCMNSLCPNLESLKFQSIFIILYYIIVMHLCSPDTWQPFITVLKNNKLPNFKHFIIFGIYIYIINIF